MVNLEKNVSTDEADIQFGPLKIQIEDIKDLKIGGQLPNSKIEEIILQIGKRKVKTLDKSFYHAKNIWDYWVNTYKIVDKNNLINESSTLINEKKYNNYLNKSKSIKN